MHIGDDVLHQVRTDGYAVVEGFLTPDELAAAREGLFEQFPTHDQYFADPDQHHSIVAHQFAGLRVGPFESWDALGGPAATAPGMRRAGIVLPAWVDEMIAAVGN